MCCDLCDLNFVPVRRSFCDLFNQSLPIPGVMFEVLGWKLIWQADKGSRKKVKYIFELVLNLCRRESEVLGLPGPCKSLAPGLDKFQVPSQHGTWMICHWPQILEGCLLNEGLFLFENPSTLWDLLLKYFFFIIKQMMQLPKSVLCNVRMCGRHY